jgi:hypothetical protein
VTDSDGWTPARTAAEWGYPELARYLKGLRPNPPVEEDGMAADFYAVASFERPGRLAIRRRGTLGVRHMDIPDRMEVIAHGVGSSPMSEPAASELRDGVYFANETEICFVREGEQARVVADIKQLDPRLNGTEISSQMWLSESAGHLYFAVFPRPDRDQGPSGIGRLDLKTLEFDLLNMDSHPGTTIDTRDGTVYQPTETQIRASAFDGVARTYQVSRRYWRCALAPGGRRLLLSQIVLDSKPRIALLDLETGTEEVLPFVGSDAVWSGESEIMFRREVSSLWRYEFGTDEPQLLFRVPGARISLRGSWSRAPVLSHDFSWACFQWAVRRNGERVHGAILADMERRTYHVFKEEFFVCDWFD